MMPDSPFVLAMIFVAARESVYSNDPDDPGAETCYGVTQKTFIAHMTAREGSPPMRSVIDITMAEVCEIYWRGYWLAARCDQVAISRPRLALVHFDCAVNMGAGQAPYCLQRAVRVSADGEIGPITMAAVAQCEESAAVVAYLEDRARVYRQIAANRPASRKFLAGWLARLRWVARATDTPITAAFAGQK